MIGVVALDLGQVLSSPPDLYSTPAALLDVEPEAYQELYWNNRVNYDAGGSRIEYYKPLLTALGVAPTGELMTQLACLDCEMWADLRPTARELLTTIADWGLRVVVVSNAPIALRRAVEQSDWLHLVEHVFISAELKLTKPDPGFYAHVTAQLGVAPQEIAFIDDRPRNVEAGAEFGWQSHLWLDDSDSLTWLRQVCERP